MRVLWIVNNLFPDAAQAAGLSAGVSGGWTYDLAAMAAESGIVLAVAAFYSGHDLKEFTVKGITYYLLPGGGRRMMLYHRGNEALWKEICKRFRPDLLHLHGTEYSHGLACLRAEPELPAVVSVQGILQRIAQEYFGGLTLFTVLRCRTLHECLRLNGMLEQKLLLRHNARYEREILHRVRYAHAVNFWDSSVTKLINDRLTVFRYDFNLRPEFYDAPKWQVLPGSRYELLAGQCGTPLKGLHILLRALAIVKKSCPAVRLTVTGVPPAGGYRRLIDSLVKRLGLGPNIRFAGPQNTREMIGLMLGTRLAVIPSAIEGTSMFLREAAFLGLPAVAAFRGGMADFIRDKKSGFLYDYPEYAYLAGRLLQLIEDDVLASQFSREGIALAEAHHDRERNFRAMTAMYETILSESKEDKTQSSKENAP